MKSDDHLLYYQSIGNCRVELFRSSHWKKERTKKYFVKFIESWSQKFKFIQKSRKGENYSDCTWARTQNHLVFKQTLETFGQFGQMVECSFII